jgi:hypothetical protein
MNCFEETLHCNVSSNSLSDEVWCNTYASSFRSLLLSTCSNILESTLCPFPKFLLRPARPSQSKRLKRSPQASFTSRRSHERRTVSLCGTNEPPIRDHSHAATSSFCISKGDAASITRRNRAGRTRGSLGKRAVGQEVTVHTCGETPSTCDTCRVTPHLNMFVLVFVISNKRVSLVTLYNRNQVIRPGFFPIPCSLSISVNMCGDSTGDTC